MPHLKCGFAQRDITPVPGTVFLDGYGFRLTPAERACAIDFMSKYAHLSAGTSGMHCYRSTFARDVVRGLRLCCRSHIRGFTGMRRGRFALACTHTHSGPACGTLAGLPINRDWLASVAEKAADAMVQKRSRPPRFGTFSPVDMRRAETFFQPPRAHYVHRQAHSRCGFCRRGRGGAWHNRKRGVPPRHKHNAIHIGRLSLGADSGGGAALSGVPALFICGRGGTSIPMTLTGLAPNS